MLNVKARLAVGILLGAMALARVDAQAPLTARDRTEIQDLVGRYARALGTCAAEEYADLFAPGGGYFFSTIRGEVRTRESLILLVKSERHCNPPAQANAAPRTVPTVTIEPTADGAKGVASLGNAGTYEDTYVKTSKGWRFKGRSVITPQEQKAQLTAQDFAAIRRLAGDDRGQYDDVFVDTPNGKRFRSSGLTLALIPDGVKGTAVLKNGGGRYEDVYVRDANGWRFTSRAYVPPARAEK